MTQTKLSDSQKRLLFEMKKTIMRYSKQNDNFLMQGSKLHYATSTAKSLLNKGMFTIGNDGICNLTELGLTIKL